MRVLDKLKPAMLAVLIGSHIVGCSEQATSIDTDIAPVMLTIGEGQAATLGYHSATPKFSWKLADTAKAQHQSAYQIQVVDRHTGFDQEHLVWDSGKVLSNQSSWVRYAGHDLQSRQDMQWRVRIWDEKDTISRWSEPQNIELGLLNTHDWQAQWIGHPDTTADKTPSQATLATPQYLFKQFDINAPFAKARLYVTAKGLFKSYINGSTVAPEDAMTPGWTPYQKRIETLSYDVTDQLIPGQNTLAAAIAGGWYAGRIMGFTETEHKKPARLLAQLEITYNDGSQQIINSDDSWLATQQGPIRFASIYDGEHVDETFDLGDWKQGNVDNSQWQPVITEALDTDVALKPKRHQPIRETQRITPVTFFNNGDNSVVFDFGQNMAGTPLIMIPAVKGQTITLRYAEALHKGAFYTENYRSAKSENRITPKQNGVLNYQPSFTYHGYRYLEVSGFDKSQTPQASWATAIVQHSDVPLHNSFQSSHPKLNQLTQNVQWGLRSNFFDIPLDCPQRDERLGWTGDAQVFATPSMYLADVYTFWSAWLESVREEQRDNGRIELYVPFVEWLPWTSSGWGDVSTIIPWELYELTGDLAGLEENYEMMLGWVAYHESKSDNNISSMMTFGDWLQPYPTPDGKDENRGDTDFSLISTAYHARSVELTLNAARALNKREDIQRLSQRHAELKHTIQTTFFDENANITRGSATQTSYLLGLAFNLFSDTQTPLAQQHLIKLIEAADGHLRTGFLGTPLLTSVLQDAGRTDLAYDLLFKESYPSWFYSINNGATTTWERWNSYTEENGFNSQGMNSLNHYAYGSVSRWFYEGILGINATTPGYKTLTIAPQFGGPLTKAAGFYDTPQGKVSVAWQREQNNILLTMTIPKNTTAVFELPKAKTIEMNGAQVSDPSMLKNIAPGHYSITLNGVSL